ncbi:MAG: hypothetical protein A3D39_01625 [Candidatus Buchananbacteria bacterium RIFCSPHIGHO2_02_FULL_39_17]|nr:MAG: hypothetical protein A3D39_01625 [Candidatus Buchananbacteria bacterium RIFCSPHIGHO2_02_FULL_39_17]
MGGYIKLADGTDFSVRPAASGKPIIYGFEPSDLEKLLTLKPNDVVDFCGEEKKYQEVKATLDRQGGIVAYLPDPGDYLNVCDLL